MNKKLSRRNFLRTSVLGTIGLMSVAEFTSCKKSDKSSATEGNARQKIGFIGLGQQGMYLLNGFLSISSVEVVAGCDVYGRKRERFQRRVTNYYKNSENEDIRTLNVEVYSNYQELLNRSDIDAVVIAVPDHSHAFVAIDACNAKKNVYLEKPLTFTVKEGQELIKAVRRNNVIFGVGSQQRSSEEFQYAVKLIQDGKLGKISKIISYVGAPPTPYDLPEEDLPQDLDWEAWLGSSYYRVHYNNQLNPMISLDPEQDEQLWGAWRWYTELGGGFTTDWGAHMFDIAQWALGKDGSGPQKIEPVVIDGETFIHYRYFDGPQIPEEGTLLTSERFDRNRKGCRFIGENGWIQVERGIENFKASNPEWMPEMNKESGDVPYETKVSHLENFVDACREKIDPVVTVEIGHSSCTVCNIGNIAVELGRELTWDPQAQKFVDDEEANAKLTRSYAPGYSI